MIAPFAHSCARCQSVGCGTILVCSTIIVRLYGAISFLNFVRVSLTFDLTSADLSCRFIDIVIMS